MPRVLFPAFALTLTLAALLAAGPTRAVPIHDFSPVAAEMTGFVQTNGLDGASLRVGMAGNVIHRRAYGGYTTDTRVRIASATKWLSALTLARVIERGQLRWTDTVGQFFPDVEPAKRGITLEQLFSHTSALPAGDSTCLSNPLFTLATCAERILQEPLIGEPGKVFAYGGNSMQVAGRMAELATGRSWDDLFLQEMVAPLGLTATDYSTSSTAAGYVRNPNPRIAGGARSTLDDYGRLVDMVLARGCLDGGFPDRCASHRRFLSAATLDAMARDRTIGTITLSRPATTTGFGYGFGMWIENADGINAQTAQPMLSSPGAFGFTPWVHTAGGVSGVLLVEDQLSRLNADIVDIRAMIAVVTRDGDGRRVRMPMTHMPAADRADRAAAPRRQGGRSTMPVRVNPNAAR
jgi:CubicO group peptidase (beta-lactamase class C family)